MSDFLLELGLEEVPARMIAGAEAELGRRVHELLTRERLLDPAAKVTTYSTPRRLAVLVEGVLAAQADVEEQLTGPSWKVAFKEDQPTPAAEAFAKKAGIAVSALQKITNSKGEYVGATIKRKGRTAAEILGSDLPKEVLSIYWAKNMYWRAGKPERFVRPVRWLVALLDSNVVPLAIAGIAAGNASRGHRVLHGPDPVVIDAPKSYPSALGKAFVLVDVATRKEKIRKALDKVTRTVSGARWREDEALVDTVLHLTEWPSVILGNFEPEYLTLPEEVLVTVMRDHQKYFAVEDAKGKLAPHFLAVLNTETDEEGAAIIRNGNARELRARFKDAQFFWDFDQKTPLVDRVESLKNVTFHKELGSYHWKTDKNKELARQLNARLRLMRQVLKQTLPDEEAILAAATLAKTDLTTELVKEFTELQGIVGGLYSREQGLDARVAEAIYWQYRPQNTDDSIPPTVEGQILGLADRMHTIVAMFSKGYIPSGSKDPFGLRRAANAIVKILAESSLPFSLSDIYDDPLRDSEGCSQAELEESLKAFFMERLNFYLRDVRGFAYDVVNATLAAGSNEVLDAVTRAEALTDARGSEAFLAVCSGFKRIKNILRQANEKGIDIPKEDPCAAALVEAEEKNLLAFAEAIVPKLSGLQSKSEYQAALEAVASLRPTIDGFFDRVMVMVPDPSLRTARLGLIQWVLSRFSQIADFSEIVTS